MNATLPSTAATGLLSQASQEWYRLRPLIPTYLHLMGSAIFPIFIAAHASLRRPASAAPPKKPKAKKDADADDETEEESSHPIETLNTSDAILFPILAGLLLSGLYVIIKWLEDPSILNKILGYYFSWAGLFFTFKLSRDTLYTLRSFVFPSHFSHDNKLYRYDFTTNGFTAKTSDGSTTLAVKTSGLFGKPIRPLRFLTSLRRILNYRVTTTIATHKPLSPSKLNIPITLLDLLALLASAAISLLTTFKRQTLWYLTNLQGFAFCYGSLQFMTPGTSAVGTLLLSLLFFYDIYMVFYTPMMVTVATKLDVPIKLLFPRPDDGTCPKPIGALPGSREMEEYLKCLAKKRTMAMLGLGDIVVPGIMIAFALRLDLYRYYLARRRKTSTTESGSTNGGKESREHNDREKDERPSYLPARGMWAERWYTAHRFWTEPLKAKDFPKPYFKATVVGYTAGLVATLLVMQVYRHAQPALLYLVPGVLSTFWGMAVWKGEVRLLWEYDEAAEEKEAEKEKEKKQTKEQETEREEGRSKEDEQEEKSKDTTRPEKESTGGKKPVFTFNVYLPPPMAEPASEKASDQKDEDNKKPMGREGEKSALRSQSTPSSAASTPVVISDEDLDDGTVTANESKGTRTF